MSRMSEGWYLKTFKKPEHRAFEVESLNIHSETNKSDFNTYLKKVIGGFDELNDLSDIDFDVDVDKSNEKEKIITVVGCNGEKAKKTASTIDKNLRLLFGIPVCGGLDSPKDIENIDDFILDDTTEKFNVDDFISGGTDESELNKYLGSDNEN